VKRIPLTGYHVVPKGKRWDVERDDAFIGSFANDLSAAIGLAIAGAQPTYARAIVTRKPAHAIQDHDLVQSNSG
jgi:hypothetical protein